MCEYYCGNCGEPCTPNHVDNGYGYTEFWGRPDFDSHEEWVSHCHEDRLYRDKELNEEWEQDEINCAMGGD